MTHLQIANTSGAKAGFEAYVEQLSKSGLPQAKATLRELRSQGNSKRQFAWYCAKFTKKLSKAQATVAKQEPVQNDAQATLIALIAQAQAQLDALNAPEPEYTRSTPTIVERVTRKARTTKAQPVKAAKENLWREWAVRKYNIPTEVGQTFTYKSKKARANTTHQVTRVTSEGVYCVRVA